MESLDASFPLPGYVVRRRLPAGWAGCVYEVAHEHEDQLLVAWVRAYGNPLERARVEVELGSLRESTPHGVGAILGIEHVRDQLIVLTERPVGVDLLDRLNHGGGPLPLGEFLSLALPLVEILVRLHAEVPVHGDLRPPTLYVDSETRRVEIGDAGLARVLDSDRPFVPDPEFVRRVLPYRAPELLRARPIDSRSDLHSIGVVFYELLTGRRPFAAASASELTHALLARRPRPPRELREGLPSQLAAIVMKLLEKLPEQRYQSALGLHADLVRLLEELGEGIAEPAFELGQHDFPTRLRMPRRLFGRAEPLARLQRSLADVREHHATQMVFVTGEAGIGKSALLRGLELPVGARVARGRFVDPLGDPPFRGFVELLTELIRQVSLESEAWQLECREQLRERLGPSSDVLGNLVPAFARFMGCETSLGVDRTAHGRGAEVECRLQIALRRFLAALAERGPIVLMLDDLDRADRSSLELLRGLAGAANGAVLIFASASWPARSPELIELRRRLVAEGRAQDIELGPLALDDLVAIVALMVGRPSDEVRELAQLLHAHCRGNPFFLRKYVRELVERGRLALGEGGWHWDLPAIAGDPPEDWPALIQARLGRLGPEVRGLLEQAACIGPQFDLRRLHAMIEPESCDEVELAGRLYELERRGLLIRVGEDFRFVHERVHEQVLADLDLQQRARCHWRLASVLHGEIGREFQPKLFELVEHIALGLPAAGPLEPSQRRELLELEFRAGSQALRLAAWCHAQRYLRSAVQLLEPDAGGLAVRLAYAQALALCRSTREADDAFAELLARQLSFTELGQVVARRIQILAMEDRHPLAIEVALAGLARCGVRLRTNSLALTLALRRARRRSSGHDLAAFAATSTPVADPRIAAVLGILGQVQYSAFVVDRSLWTALSVEHVHLVLAHGFHPTAASAFVQQALVFAAIGESSLADELATQAEVLARRGPAELRPRVACRVRLFVWPYTRPYREVVAGIDELFRQVLDVGDRDVAGYLIVLGLRSQLEAGLPLREVVSLGKRGLAELQPWATADQRAGILCSLRAAELLLGRARAHPDIDPDLRSNSFTAMGVANAEALVDWLLGRRAQAFERLDALAIDVTRAGFGTWLFARHAVLHAVGAVERFEREGRPPERRRAVIRVLRTHRIRLCRQAGAGPVNFLAMFHLVDAEFERVRGRFDAAQQAYEHARAYADERGQAYVAGIAAERLADLAAWLGLPTTAAGALRQARASYLRWGAFAVVERLEHEHRELFGDNLHRDPTTPRLGEFDWDLDRSKLLATMQAISEELGLERVIVQVLAAAIDHARADRGVLLLERGGQVGIVAEGTPNAISEYHDVPTPLSGVGSRLPRTVIEAVLRTGKPAIFDLRPSPDPEFVTDPELAADPYFIERRAGSLLCLAIAEQGRSCGALVLECDSPVQPFTRERLEVLRSFANQAAAALDNAQLYAALQCSEAQWRSVVAGVPDIIALHDVHGRIEFINHLDAFTIDPASLVGRLAETLMTPSSFEVWTTALQAVLAGAGPQSLEIQTTLPRQPPHWFALRMAAIEVAGRVEKVITIATDIDERKLDEAAQARLEVQLRHQQRLESLGTLASGVAHEINNPIQGIMNYAELIAGRPADHELVQDFAGEIRLESERIAAIVRNLMAFSRQEQDPSDSEWVSVASLIDRLLSLIRTVLRKQRVELEVDIADDLPVLHCRPHQVQQVLMNLVTNARDALDERRAAGPERWIGLRARSFVREGATWIRMSVEDRGGGIDEGLLGRIFDPFFTTKGRDKGTGLGLAVSHGIAIEHGGRLWVDNRPGVGATFHLDLPAGHGAA